jgi:hypothetical protein
MNLSFLSFINLLMLLYYQDFCLAIFHDQIKSEFKRQQAKERYWAIEQAFYCPVGLTSAKWLKLKKYLIKWECILY